MFLYVLERSGAKSAFVQLFSLVFRVFSPVFAPVLLESSTDHLPNTCPSGAPSLITYHNFQTPSLLLYSPWNTTKTTKKYLKSRSKTLIDSYPTHPLKQPKRPVITCGLWKSTVFELKLTKSIENHHKTLDSDLPMTLTQNLTRISKTFPSPVSRPSAMIQMSNQRYIWPKIWCWSRIWCFWSTIMHASGRNSRIFGFSKLWAVLADQRLKPWAWRLVR